MSCPVPVAADYLDPIPAALIELLEEEATRTIILIESYHSGIVERISCSDDAYFGTDLYSGGQGMALKSMFNFQSAVLEMAATPTRISEALNETWLHQLCTIRMLAAGLGDDAAVSGYGDETNTVTLVSGRIQSSALRGSTIQVTIEEKYLTGRQLPYLKWNQFCSHMPAAGETIEWENETALLAQPPSVLNDRTKVYW